MPRKKIIIIGGGIAGLSAALHLFQANFEVAIIEKNTCGSGASRVAAGMLAPMNELEFTEVDMLSIGIESRRQYDAWEALLGDIGIQRSGTLEVAATADDIPYLKRLYDFQCKQGLQVQWVEADHIQAIEPAISSEVRAAIFAPDDIQVDNRLLCAKIKNYLISNGVSILEHEQFEDWSPTPDGLCIRTHKGMHASSVLLLCTGAWQSQLNQQDGLPEITPVKGEMLMLEPNADFILNHVVRIRNRILGNGYIVPKKNGIVIGASSEYQGFHAGLKMGNMMDIMRRAWQVVPGLYELNILETYTGFRPAAQNHRPVIGKVTDAPVFYLNGLYRHGILLGPWAGSEIRNVILQSIENQ
jgi:glycine oxidase